MLLKILYHNYYDNKKDSFCCTTMVNLAAYSNHLRRELIGHYMCRQCIHHTMNLMVDIVCYLLHHYHTIIHYIYMSLPPALRLDRLNMCINWQPILYKCFRKNVRYIHSFSVRYKWVIYCCRFRR